MPRVNHTDVTIRPGVAAELIDLRHLVLRTHLPREAAEYDVDAWPMTRHWVATTDGGRVAGCVTIFPMPLDEQTTDAWQLRGMAVDPLLQGAGVGAKLLDAVDAYLRALTPRPALVWCNARVSAVGFYERCGWTVISGIYDVPTVGPHKKMVKRLTVGVR